MTESGETDGSGRPKDQTGAKATPSGPVGEMPRWQPFADVPPAAPVGATATPGQDPASVSPGPRGDPTENPMSSTGIRPFGAYPRADPSATGPGHWGEGEPPAAESRVARFRGRSAGALITIIALVVSGFFTANRLRLLPNDDGKVLFGMSAGPDVCSVVNPTKTVATTDSLFWAAVLRHHMDGHQAIALHITKDGEVFLDDPIPADGTEFDCYGNTRAIHDLDPGAYTFQIIHNGEIEATGDLTVT